MLIDTTGALAREHIADLRASADRHHLAREARRARDPRPARRSRPVRRMAAPGTSACRPAAGAC